MADIGESSGSSHKKEGGRRRPKKVVARADLTPLVDLAFLLITFFIFTTTMSSPSAMKLPFPDDTAKTDEQQKVAESGVWTIIVTDNPNADKYLFYPGRLAADGSNLYSLKDPEIQTRLKEVMNLKGAPTIRDLILYGQNQAKNANVDYVLVVKPLNESHFDDMVNILNEVLITDVSFYTLQKIQDQELVLVKQKLQK